MVDLILEKLAERVDEGDLDSAEFLHYLEVREYSENLVIQIFNAANDEHRVLLLDLLNANDIFKNLRRHFRRLEEELDYADDVETLIDSMEEEIGIEY